VKALKRRAGELLPWAESCAASAQTDAWRDIAAILRAVAGGRIKKEFSPPSRIDEVLVIGGSDGRG
jgi:hypothetical protein